ncbi:MAG: lipopolysaccharide kinase InaA family protein [Kiritimatiellia bacterium]
MEINSSSPVYQPPGREACIKAAALYRAALRMVPTGIRSGDKCLAGCWADRPDMSPVELLSLIQESIARPDAAVIKQTGRITVTRTRLEGAEVIIKGYDLSGTLENLKYLFRHSRARRFWAAALTLRQLGIPTPEPMGFLECWKHGIPAASFIITGFVPDTDDASRWLGWTSNTKPEDVKRALAKDLASAIAGLYSHGIYHRDTKTSNLLLEYPLDPVRRRFLWLDLECLTCGVRPGRHKIIRNVVQVVGSLGPEATCAERELIIREFACIFPWLTGRNVMKRIHCWTDRRMHKERRCC